MPGPLITFDLHRGPPGVATARYLAARWRRTGDAGVRSAAVVLASLDLRRHPSPSLTTFGVISIWTGCSPAERGAAACRLTLEPVRSSGTWRGVDPLPGLDERPAGPGPVVVVTHGAGRLRGVVPFWRVNHRAVAALRASPSCVWDQGWAGRPQDAGTLSVWSDEAAVEAFGYRDPGHAARIGEMRRGRWTSSFWSARAEVVAIDGTWPGLTDRR